MADGNWMIYGATGYTGRLLAERALERGHLPVLAGRSLNKLKPLAERLDLPYRAFPLNDADMVAAELREAGVELVLHAAGPFIHTAEPMVQGCLRAGAHYLDITGEIVVFERIFTYAAEAEARDLVLLPGVGFDVVPTDCLAKYVADQLPDALQLDIVLNALNAAGDEIGMSPGTLKTMLEQASGGGTVRRGGELMPYDLGMGTATFPFATGEQIAMVIPWGDVATAYRSTGIPNITAYSVFDEEGVRGLRAIGYVAQKLLTIKPLRRWIGTQIDQYVPGPGEAHRQTMRSEVYARVTNAAGEQVEAWLETLEGYQFTLEAALRAVERVQHGSYRGALTPAMAFGADFVLEIDGTERFDTLAARQR